MKNMNSNSMNSNHTSQNVPRKKNWQCFGPALIFSDSDPAFYTYSDHFIRMRVLNRILVKFEVEISLPNVNKI
jgi:hypothetical protein